MIQQKAHGIAHNLSNVLLARVVFKDVNLVQCVSPLINYKILLFKKKIAQSQFRNEIIFTEVNSIDHLDLGDILQLNPVGSIYTLFRRNSDHNSIFVTGRCNNNCLMCSQPPVQNDDIDYYDMVNTQLLAMLPTDIPSIGFTGGEPTLAGYRFIELMKLATQQLPNTNFHILTNGKAFVSKDFTKKVKDAINERTVFGIPLYSDHNLKHDFIVQSKDAFNQTIKGLHNMARWGLRVEIRIVIHKVNYQRLPSLASFIYKNLPFAEHVAFMGMEYTGHAIANFNHIWIEPQEYENELEEAILYLNSMGIRTSIYNIQHCLMKKSLWTFSRNAISDWKKEYFDICTKCLVKNDCCGNFSTSKKISNEIKAVIHTGNFIG